MAKFYGVNLNSEELAKVVDHCGFSHMKKNTHLFNYFMPFHPSNVSIMKHGTMTRKGTIGDGKVTFTEEGMITVSASLMITCSFHFYYCRPSCPRHFFTHFFSSFFVFWINRN